MPLCPGCLPSLPPAPPWTASEAEKRSRSALRVTEAAAAARARYCVSLERQSLCTEAEGAEAPRAWVTHHGGDTHASPRCGPCGLRVAQPAVAQGAATWRGGTTGSFAPSPRAAPGAAGCREPSEPPGGQAGDQDPRTGLGTPGSPSGSAGAGDRVRAPSSGTAGAGDGAEMLGGVGEGAGGGDKGAGRGL